MRRLILIICFSLPGFFAQSQTWEVGVTAGAAGYMGDINPIKPYKFTDPVFGALAKRNFNGRWSAKVAFLQGKIQGDDAKSSNAYQNDRNLHFRTDLSELSLQLEFNFFNYLPGGMSGFNSRRFSPFLFAGVAGVAFNPVADFGNDEVELHPLQTEGVDYKKNAISVPYGVGVKYNITGNWNLIGDIGYRTAFTDYLDDISGRYPDFTSPASPITQDLSDRSISGASPGQQRGDFRPRDTYMFSTISLTYTFVSLKCPMF
ncbi:MAG: DUF6089 family protein [Daejeonella sp.]|uniref:type IX secretion system protein PorG n=1 Tax=Daejeonella sp. TaxID=2805397 RepID=UPI003C733082